MASEFHKRAISRITIEQRALMVKSLEIISQIHAILDKKNINQKELAQMMNVSPAAVSKMLSLGSNLEINTVVKIELLLGETVITTPQKIESNEIKGIFRRIPKPKPDFETYMKLEYIAGIGTLGPGLMTGTHA